MNPDPNVQTTEEHRPHDGPEREIVTKPREGAGPHGLGRQFAELSQEAVVLIRGEVALARAELNEKISQLEQGLMASVTGGAVLFAGFLVLLSAAVFAIGIVLPLWAAALIVGGITALIGAASLGKGTHDLSKSSMKPKRMIQETKANASFAKEQMG